MCMPKLIGIYEIYKEAENIPIDNIIRWIHFRIEPHHLENFIANRLLYPQTLPLTSLDFEIDLAILREVIKKKPNLLVNSETNKITIPESLILRFNKIELILKCILDVLKIKGVVTVNTKDHKITSDLVGTIYAPSNLPQEDILGVSLNGKKYNLKKGSINIIPSSERHNNLIISTLPEISVIGGKLGIVIDLRG